MDENKTYKLHEIIKFLENNNIEVGTRIFSDESKITLKVYNTPFGLSLRTVGDNGVYITSSLIKDDWKIKEARFYVKAPKTFIRKYLIEYVNPETNKAYQDFVSNPDDTGEHGRTMFTKQEVEELMLYGDNFFISEEVKDND